MARLSRQIGAWLDERAGLGGLVRTVFLRNVPLGVGVLYTLGFAAAFVFVLQAVTGIALALFYAPTPDHAYASVTFVMMDVSFGRVLRGLHHWGSSAMVVLVVAHLVVVYAFAAYKRPREVTWFVGVVLLLLTLAFAFTGYLLPWDERAFWATSVGTNMIGTVPYVGEFLLRAARGGSELGAATLTRFYAIHVLILPAITGALVFAHVALVIWHGVSVPPSLWGSQEGSADRADSEAARYASFKQRGRPFWPDVIAEDLVVAVVVFSIILAIAVAVGAPLDRPADPTNASYIPRPEWYFLFLFELLRYFPGQLEWVGVALLPAVGILVVLIIPLVDRGPERQLLRRPVAAVSAVVLAGSVAFLTTSAALTSPPPTDEGGRTLTAAQVLGRIHYRQYCEGCHGRSGEGAPDGPSLAAAAQKGDGGFIHSYIESPDRLNRRALMPGFLAQMGHQQVEETTQFVLTLVSEGGP